MSRLHISDPFPPTPSGFHHTLIKTLSEVEAEKMKKKHKYTLSLAAALVLVLAIGCIALAANSKNLLSYLFEGREATEDAHNLIVEPQLSVEKNGLKLSIDEYIQDGNTLTVLWSVESTLDQPLLYGSEYPVLTPRHRALVTGAGIGYEELILLDEPKNGIQSSKRAQATMRYKLEDSAGEQPIRFDLTVRFFTPGGEIVKGNEYDEINGDTQNLVICEYGYTRPAMYTAVQDSRGGAELDIDVFTRLGYVKPFEELSISLEIEPSRIEIAHTQVDGTNTFEFDQYTLVVDTLDFSTASTIVKLYIIPKESLGEDESLSWYYILTDSQGNYVMADMTGGWSGQWTFDGGIQKFYWEGDWGPLTSVPEEVTVMPVEDFTFDGAGEDRDKDYYEVQKSHYITEDAVTVRLK